MAARGDTADRINFADLMQKKIINSTIGKPSSFYTGTVDFFRMIVSENLRKKLAFGYLLVGGNNYEC